MKSRTLANLTRWPAEKLEALEAVLKGLPPTMGLERAFEVARSLPHGHVAAALGTAERLGLAELIDPEPSATRPGSCPCRGPCHRPRPQARHRPGAAD